MTDIGFVNGLTEQVENCRTEESMSRKITMPKCPYCGKEKKYQLSDYDTSKLVSLATGVVVSDVTIRCAGHIPAVVYGDNTN